MRRATAAVAAPGRCISSARGTDSLEQTRPGALRPPARIEDIADG
jgi:hypothetical protein